MRYVERDAGGRIVGTYASPQPGRAEEPLADDHPELAALRGAKERAAAAARDRALAWGAIADDLLTLYRDDPARRTRLPEPAQHALDRLPPKGNEP